MYCDRLVICARHICSDIHPVHNRYIMLIHQLQANNSSHQFSLTRQIDCYTRITVYLPVILLSIVIESGNMLMKNNRTLTIIGIVVLFVLALVVFNLNNVLMIASILQSLAITALCVVAIMYLMKRI